MSATCIETYLQAVSAAHQQMENTIALCGSQACIDAAIATYTQQVAAAEAAYHACISGGGGGGND